MSLEQYPPLLLVSLNKIRIGIPSILVARTVPEVDLAEVFKSVVVRSRFDVAPQQFQSSKWTPVAVAHLYISH